VVCQ
jgi:hypothetical protein